MPRSVTAEDAISDRAYKGRAGQGNRLNDSCGDVGGEGVFVPCGDFASHAQRILVFASSEHIEGDVLDDGEVEGGVVGTHAAFVVAEDHVEDPVETVFDHPMTAHSGDLERSIRSIMNTDSGDHEHPLALA